MKREPLGRFANLTRWSDLRALVEKIEHLRYPTIFVEAQWTVFLKLLFQSYK